MPIRICSGGPGRPRLRAAVATALATALALVAGGLVAAPAQAAGQRVNLRVLVVTNGDPGSLAMEAELDREGIPFTEIDTRATGRPTITDAYLQDAATGTGRFQGVVLPNQAGGGLAAAEVTALAAYEAAFGVRQINGYDFPTATMGTVFSGVSGTLDGTAATVTPAGLAGPFSYLKGPLTIENVDPTVSETFGYLANADPAIAAGSTFTPLVTDTLNSSTGSIVGVYAHGGREELVVTASFNQYMQWFDMVAPGIVSWLTRGIELGYHRNYFAMHVDDVLLADSRWSAAAHCTPGDDGCSVTSTSASDLRMLPADVTTLVNWQKANNFSMTMLFNGYGSDAFGGAADPLTQAFLANKTAFPWVNHTYSHPFVGCIQIAPTVAGATWHCATSATEAPRMDPDVTQALGPDGIYYASGDYITSAVQDNITWARTNALPNFDPTVLVTGEHSGIKTLPQQPNDNPFLAPALAALGVKWTGSDGSREADTRALSGTTSTVPRHPMNIFYNTATYQDEVDEYNWIYTATANGGSGTCTANPTTSTCITPLDASSAAAAKTSFDTYIQPLEVRNALKYILTNDPRPFYAHQSNLAGDGILYPVLTGILATYNAAYDTTTPLVQPSITDSGQALAQMNAWKTASKAPGYTDGYVDAAGVHLPAASVAVPLTVPPGSTGTTGLHAYGRALSGWVGGGSTVVPPTTAGGYLVGTPAPAATVPGAPTNVTAVAGSAAATVSWTAPASNGGSPITGYVVRVYTGTSTTPSTSATAAATATSLAVTGLGNGTSYRFDVAAVNAVGTGAASALTAAVTPRAALAPVPTNVNGEAGNASVTVRWTPPANTAGITGYRVRAFLGTTIVVAKTVNVGPTLTVAAVPGLANGVAYTFGVNAVTANATGGQQGPSSVSSPAVTPSLTSQTATAPSVTGVTVGQGSAAVAFQPPSELAGTTPTGYRVRAFVAGSTTSSRSVTVAATATSASVTGLTNGTSYQFEVNVVTVAGQGPTSARSAGVAPAATAPSAPVIGTAASGTAGGAITATARWSAPTSTGGSPVTGYVVTATQYGTAGQALGQTTSPMLAASTRSYAMTLPTAGSYRFTVVAVNAIGTSPASARSNLVTAR
jgi:fibronectin type 3 domain-containing protein